MAVAVEVSSEPIPGAAWEMAAGWGLLTLTSVVVASLKGGPDLNESGAAGLTTLLMYLVVSGFLQGRRGAVSVARFCYAFIGVLCALTTISAVQEQNWGNVWIGGTAVAVALHGARRVHQLVNSGWVARRMAHPIALRHRAALLVAVLTSTFLLASLQPRLDDTGDQAAMGAASEIAQDEQGPGSKLTIADIRRAAASLGPDVRLVGLSDRDHDGMDDDLRVVVLTGGGAACLHILDGGWRIQVGDQSC